MPARSHTSIRGIFRLRHFPQVRQALVRIWIDSNIVRLNHSIHQTVADWALREAMVTVVMLPIITLKQTWFTTSGTTVHFSWHDDETRLQLWQVDFIQASARTGGEQAQVVADFGDSFNRQTFQCAAPSRRRRSLR